MTIKDDIHPFEVFYDADKYYIFAPDGCVLVGGVAAEIVDASNGNVELDLDPEDLPDYLYAHVTEDSSATGGYKVEFDGEATKTGAEWNFRVVRFGASENDGNQYDIATSVVNLGGGSTPTPSTAVPQPFDIENGYVVRCRIFAPIAEATCSDYAINTSGGDIYVHLDRSTNGYALSVDQTSRQNSATHAQWRLYAYSNGAPTLDLRPRILPVFELVS